jgi:hypothetical protein
VNVADLRFLEVEEMTAETQKFDCVERDLLCLVHIDRMADFVR